MAPPPARLIAGRAACDAVDDAEQVDLDDPHELVEVERVVALGRGDAGVEVGGVQPAVLGLDLRDDGLVGGPVGDVEDDERAAEVGGDLPVALAVEVGEDGGDVQRLQLRRRARGRSRRSLR